MSVAGPSPRQVNAGHQCGQCSVLRNEVEPRSRHEDHFVRAGSLSEVVHGNQSIDGGLVREKDVSAVQMVGRQHRPPGLLWLMGRG